MDANFEIACSDCGTTYSSDESSCPHCNPQSKSKETKTLEPGTLIWEFEAGEVITTCPTIGLDDTVYVGSMDKNLYAIDSRNGAKKWEHLTDYRFESSPAIGRDGVVYFSETVVKRDADIPLWGKVCALDARTGRKVWELDERFGDASDSPAVGSDGTVYIGHYCTYLAINGRTGTLIWEFETGRGVVSSPAIGPDGTVYVSQLGNLCALDAETGAEKWDFNFKVDLDHIHVSEPAIDSDGTIYVGAWDDKIYAINSDGTKKWESETDSTPFSCPAIGVGGTIYVGTREGKVYALDSSNGAKIWSFVTGDNVHSTPAIDSEGTIYIGSNDHSIYAINPDGTKKWRFETGGKLYQSPTIGFDGTLYVGSYDGKLYALATSSSGPADSPWPMRGQNPQHTGRAPQK